MTASIFAADLTAAGIFFTDLADATGCAAFCFGAGFVPSAFDLLGFADFCVLTAALSGTALRTAAGFAADLGLTGAFFFCAIFFLTLAY
jgi:hypothetical protein